LLQAELHAELLHAHNDKQTEAADYKEHIIRLKRQVGELQYDIDKASTVSANDSTELKHRLAHLLQIAHVAFDTGSHAQCDGSIRTLIDQIAQTIQLAATSDRKIHHKNQFLLENYKEHINRLQIEVQDAHITEDQSRQHIIELEGVIQQLQVQLQEVIYTTLYTDLNKSMQGTERSLAEEQKDLEAMSSLQSELVLTKKQLSKTAERLSQEQDARLKLQSQKRLAELKVAEQKRRSSIC
jgi:hypothetical protein